MGRSRRHGLRERPESSMARRYRGEGRSVGAAQIWALSYFDVADAFLASLVERLLSVCRRPHRGRSAPLPNWSTT